MTLISFILFLNLLSYKAKGKGEEEEEEAEGKKKKVMMICTQYIKKSHVFDT